MRLFTHLLLLVFFVAIFGIGLTWLSASGVLWGALGERVANNPRYAAAYELSKAEFGSRYDYIIVGDGEFIALVQQLIGRANVLTCQINKINLKDIPPCLNAIRAKGIQGMIIIPKLPFFFSDVVNFGSQPAFGFLPLGEESALWSRAAIKASFNMIKVWSKAPLQASAAAADRPLLNELVSFEARPKGYEAFVEGAAGLEDRLIWLTDVEGVDYSVANRFWYEYSQQDWSASGALPAGRMSSLDEIMNSQLIVE